MAWSQLSIDKPHLVYIILGGFTTLFMLVSSVIKEKMYIGEATVATLCGVIFGPHAADLINPATWGNVDDITLEFARIVLVVQCFAVGVELPRYYMEKHWRSVVFLLVPVMTFGWLVTSLFIWAVFNPYLNWLDSLVCAACVTATDPVLASSVVGKGKFAKRVPKHLRDLLSAESGCNDGMAFPFVYLGIYIVQYYGQPNEVALHWFCYTILYECIFGAVYGVIVGYLARRAIRFSHEKGWIDRESFLVFYFVLALFCAGSGSLLGMDDLLIGFACGVGFSNDGWFTEKTEESHVSNVIDLLINLAFFVYFGTIIPWEQYNSSALGIEVWKLIVIAILVLFFRRIPVMLALKPFIPDVKTWREALFAGHFGPIGVGAIFVAILARAELETDTTTPANPDEIASGQFPHTNIIVFIWPITTFLVITSILVHGSSIAVFTLGKHINTLTITMSYTQASEGDGNWMDRLPRIQSRSKSSMSRDADSDLEMMDEKMPDYPPAALPRNFLRRQREEDTPAPLGAYARRRKHRSWGGGHVDPSAIEPQRSGEDDIAPELERSESDTLSPGSPEDSPRESKVTDNEKSPETQQRGVRGDDEPEEEVYREGKDTVFEDEEGNVLEVMRSKKDETEKQREADEEKEARRLAREDHIEHGEAQTGIDGDHKEQHGSETDDQDAAPKKKGWKGTLQKWHEMNRERREAATKATDEKIHGGEKPKRAPARAFRFGRTIIVEDEDGEVIKKYEIPAPERQEMDRKQSYVDPEKTKQRLAKMSKALGVGKNAPEESEEGQPSSSRPGMSQRRSSKRVIPDLADEDDDRRIRFTVDGENRRMGKSEFIKQLEGMNPRTRMQIVEESDAPEMVKEIARADAAEHQYTANKKSEAGEGKPRGEKLGMAKETEGGEGEVSLYRAGSKTGDQQSGEGLTLVGSRNEEIPFHSITSDLRKFARASGHETAAQRRRRLAASSGTEDDHHAPPSQEDGSDDEQPRLTGAEARRRRLADQRQVSSSSQEETAAERRRREGALGISHDDSDEDESRPRHHGKPTSSGPTLHDQSRTQSIRFADEGETPAERRRRAAALGTSGINDSDEEDEPRQPPPRAVPGRRADDENDDQEGQGTRRGIRFADAVRPAGKVLPSIRWKQ